MVESRGIDEGQVELVTISRADRRNALDLVTCLALMERFPLEPPPGRRCYLLHGEADAFCAGADRDEIGSTDSRLKLFAALAGLYERLQTQPLPIVAWVNGPAIGAGAILALSCDLRIVAPSARLAIPGSRYGIALSPENVKLLARELGQSISRGVLLANQELTATSMLETRIAHGPAQSLEAAMAWTLTVAAGAPIVLMAHRRALQGNEDDARERYSVAAASDDLREGLAASKDNRPTKFRGA